MTFGFDPSQGLIVVPVRLVGPAGDMIVRLALDTGATSTLMNSEIMVLLGYDPATSPHRIQVTTGSGVELCPRVTGQRLDALGRSINDFSVFSHTLPPTSKWTACSDWTSFAASRSA
jgi:Aspartyl protease